MGMQVAGARRSFRREGEERRREDLIAAALDLIAEGGTQAATVRAIAERAGVTPGLIRHYFDSKDDLILAAYATLMDRLTEEAAAVLEGAPEHPRARLAAFVRAAVTPPVVDARAMGLWAGFIHRVQADPAMRAVHRESYLTFRDRLQGLISACGVADARAAAIACNAVIDGLWLEGSALPDAFDEDELETIALRSVGAIIGLELE